MATLINLNRARKQRQREERARKAAENRLVHGLSKAERAKQATEADAAARKLEGLHLGPAPGGATDE